MPTVAVGARHASPLRQVASREELAECTTKGRPAVFIDRDGTLNVDPTYLTRPDDLELLPGVGEAVRLLNERGWLVFVVTNQSGVARGYLTLETLHEIHGRLSAEVARDGARFDGIFFCPHHPDAGCGCRKPAPGLVRQAQERHHIDLARSWVIGDSPRDIALGRALGCHTALVAKNGTRVANGVEADVVAMDLLDAVRTICNRGSS